MAVRIGLLQDSTLVARRLGTVRYLTCASRAYLEQYGEPAHPDELNAHIGLQYSNINYRQQWHYQTPEGKTIHAQPHIRIHANNGEALAAAASAGLGITRGPTFILGRYLKAGKLVSFLNEYQHEEVGIYAVYPPGRLTPRRIQALSDYLAKCYGDHPYWDKGLTKF